MEASGYFLISSQTRNEFGTNKVFGGIVMARRTTTIFVEPRLLVREALESLIKNYHYRVVCSVGSTVEISNPTMVRDGPKLVILGADSTDDAVAEAVSIRKLWSNSKIVLLFEHASVADFQKVLMSEVDGCVPLFASPETLIKTLDLVMIEGAARVVVTASARRPAIRPPRKTRHVIHKRGRTRPRPAAPNTRPNRSMWPPCLRLGLP